jgi:fatty-acid desaturase|tara:strand:- start:855 stop:1151 length:297 start_codon:yes stop_codon:yes gene_type:complete
MTQKFSKEELQNSKRIYKSATPKLTIDWYIKWVSSVLLIMAMFARGFEELKLLDLVFSTLGCMGWLVVSLIWKDRALIILNSLAVFVLGSGIVRYFLT